MALGAIATIIRIGAVVYRVASTSNRFPKTYRVLRRQGAYEGAQYGAGLGAFVANVEHYYDQTETGIIGIPTSKQQRNDRRFRKTRNPKRCPPGSRRYGKKCYNRYR